MTARHPQSRPWYCSDKRVASYEAVLRAGGNPTMIQWAKVLRTIVLNAIIGILAWGAMAQGGDPTVVPVVAFVALSVTNGFEYSDWAAFREAYQETKQGGDP